MRVSIPLRLKGGLNAREHWRVRHERVLDEREAVAWAFKSRDAKASLQVAKGVNPDGRWVVTLTRVAPRKLDDDNLVGRLKSTRDEVAKVLGIDDRHTDRLRFLYTQSKGKPQEYAVEIEVVPAAQWDAQAPYFWRDHAGVVHFSEIIRSAR